jgi:parallel beta-helix repeat protein
MISELKQTFRKLILLSTLAVLIGFSRVYASYYDRRPDVSSVRAETAGGTVYIRADGSVDPPSASILRNGDIYTLIGNLTSDADGIVIERNNMTLDGAGFSLQGPEVEMGVDRGVDLSYRSNITIKNVKINGFSRGFFLNYSYSNTVSGNNVTNCYYGVIISSSSSNYIFGNNMVGNCEGTVIYKGVDIDVVFSSSNNTISENNITNGYYSGHTRYGYAGVYISGCSSNNVSGNNITNNDYGVDLVASSNNNTVFRNNVASNDRYGVILWFSRYNAISGNSMTANYNASIALEASSNNSISGNSVTDSGCGIDLEAYSTGSSNNRIYENNVADNVVGVSFSYSSSNAFYLNNFQNNTYQVRSDNSSANTWDDGSRGNYCSNYLIKYPNAAEIDNSGIWNTSYVIDANNIDHYPLTKQYSVLPEFPSFYILPFSMMATLLAVTIYRRKGKRNEEKRAVQFKRIG